jgi:hypothetical protein
MKNYAFGMIIALVAASTGGGPETRAASPTTTPAFVFKQVSYFHRWSQNEQHEFTPATQEDLEKWADMITINGYSDVRDGEGLAARANAVLENYKAHQAIVLKTDSVPRTADHPAEHLIAVVFGRPTFIEVAFARFRLVEGKGFSVVYSHRIYGTKIGDQMSAWLKDNGAATEKALLEWKSIPTAVSPKLDRADARRGNTRLE